MKSLDPIQEVTFLEASRCAQENGGGHSASSTYETAVLMYFVLENLSCGLMICVFMSVSY